jgi:hypothetical protein
MGTPDIGNNRLLKLPAPPPARDRRPARQRFMVARARRAVARGRTVHWVTRAVPGAVHDRSDRRGVCRGLGAGDLRDHQDPFIVYTSNIFAILGLRALYFALAAMIHRFHYLKYALALVLVFIGSKIFLVGFIGKIPAPVSLGVTFALIAGGVVVSLWKTRPGTPAAAGVS